MKRNRHWDDDALYDSIHQGDRECVVCGMPSWGMLDRQVLCKRHYEQLAAKVQKEAQHE